MKRLCGLLLLIVPVASCASGPPEQQIVNDAARALGGRDRIMAVRSLVMAGDGSNGNLGQDMTPEATGERFNVTEYRRAVDFTVGQSRTEQTRTPNFAYFQGPQPQQQVFGVAGDIAYNVGVNGVATRASNAVAADRRAEIDHHPITIVRAALDPAAALTNPRTAGKERVVEVAASNGLSFTLAIDSTTNLPTRVVSMTDHPNLGDVAIETSFTDYQEVNGLELPAHFTTKTDNYTTADIRITKQTVDGDTGNLRAPEAVVAAAPITGPPPAEVTVQEVAKGVWFLAGQSHHSVVVEFTDHLILIEAPQNDTRTLAVIAKARALRPNKPLTHVVNTHHHFDHSGGIRAAVSEGLAVITQKANAQFFRDAINRPHTIVPDALAKNPKPLKLEAVDEGMELADDTMTIQLYRIDGNPHGDAMLMAYLPKQRILVEADAFNPGAAVQPYAANLLENITKHNLRVDRIVPLHGTIAPFSDLVKTQQPATTAN